MLRRASRARPKPASCLLRLHVAALRDARAVGRGALWGLTRWCDAVLAGRGDGAQGVSALPPMLSCESWEVHGPPLHPRALPRVELADSGATSAE